MKKELSQTSVKELIEKNYKGVSVEDICIDKDTISLKVIWKRGRTAPRASVRIFREFPEIQSIHFKGGWVDTVYTRNTLLRAGYKI